MCRAGPLAVHVQYEHLISHYLTVRRILLFPEEETYQPNVLKIIKPIPAPELLLVLSRRKPPWSIHKGDHHAINSAVSAKSWHVSFGLRRPQKGSLVRFLVECV